MDDKQQEKTTASVVYNPGPEDPVETTWNNIKFVKGVAVELDDPIMIESAKGNPAFNVDGEDKAQIAEERREQEAKDALVALETRLEAEYRAMNERQDGERDQLEKKHDAERAAFETRAKQSLPPRPRPAKGEGKPAKASSPPPSSSPTPPPVPAPNAV